MAAGKRKGRRLANPDSDANAVVKLTSNERRPRDMSDGPPDNSAVAEPTEARRIRAENSARRAAALFSRPENARLLEVSEADEVAVGPLDPQPGEAPPPTQE